MFSLIGKEFIPINWIQKADFCEYSLFLEEVKKLHVPPTIAMIEGRKRHSEIEKGFKEEAFVLKESLSSYLKKLIKKEVSPISLRELRIHSLKFKLSGRIDEIRLFEDKAFLIDNKRTISASHFTSQLRAYCLVFSEQFNWRNKIYSFIQNSDSLGYFFVEEFNDEAEKEITQKIRRMHRLFNGLEEFIPSQSKQKCFSCRFNFLCRHSLHKKQSFL